MRFYTEQHLHYCGIDLPRANRVLPCERMVHPFEGDLLAFWQWYSEYPQRAFSGGVPPALILAAILSTNDQSTPLWP